MIICSASRRYLLLAGTIGTLAVAVWPAAAQQTPAASEAPPPWAQGRPEAAIGAKLAPIASPPLPTAADKLPIAKLKAPKGFKIEALCKRSRECAFIAARRQGHRVRQQPHLGQGLCYQ